MNQTARFHDKWLTRFSSTYVKFARVNILVKNPYFFPNPKNQGKLFLPSFSRCFRHQGLLKRSVFIKEGMKIKQMAQKAKLSDSET